MSGALTFATAPGSVAGLNVPVNAALSISDELSDAVAPSISATGFDGALAKFQTILNRDLLMGV